MPPPPTPFAIVSVKWSLNPAKLISDDSSSDNEDIDFNQGTKLGTLKKSIFSLVDVIFFIQSENKTKYSEKDFQRAIFEIIASLEKLPSLEYSPGPFGEKKSNGPGYYSRRPFFPAQRRLRNYPPRVKELSGNG